MIRRDETEGFVMLEIRGSTTLLQVYDMTTALDFYCRILEFETVTLAGPPDDIGFAFLRRGEIELMLNTIYEMSDRPPSHDRAREAGHGDTCLYFACPDVDAAYRYLQSHGLEVREPTEAPYGMKQLYLRDPDGYGICFQWPVKSAAASESDRWVSR